MRLGYAFCGSYCTHSYSLAVLEELCKDGYEIQPIFSENVAATSTRFGAAQALRSRVEALCNCPVICTVAEAEPLGPARPLDALIIAPCTGNTLAKMACGITDTAVCMAAKAHLRTDRPTLIALASNDAMSANLKNIGALLQRKQVFFVPMRQDDPQKKPHSLVADFSLLRPALDAMLSQTPTQLRPLFLT